MAYLDPIVPKIFSKGGTCGASDVCIVAYVCEF